MDRREEREEREEHEMLSGVAVAEEAYWLLGTVLFDTTLESRFHLLGPQTHSMTGDLTMSTMFPSNPLSLSNACRHYMMLCSVRYPKPLFLNTYINMKLTCMHYQIW